MLPQPTPVAPVSLLHVEDSPIWIELVQASAHCWPEVCYSGFVSTLEQARERCRSRPPALLLLDVMLPDGSALELVEELRGTRVGTKIILCTSCTNEVILHHFDRLMLEGLVWKEYSLSPVLHAAFRAVLAGGRYFPPELREIRRRLRADPNAWFKLLSDREQELLPLLGAGQTDGEIGDVMKLSPNTVHSHRRSIMQKLGLHRTVELIQWAQRTGFVFPSMMSSFRSHRNR
jgi:DNA-binding NarL/FixJ family response regulator